MAPILVIDDDPIIRVFLKRSLQNEGYEVVVASSGQEGIEQAKKIAPALIICDWIMPEMTGLEVCQVIKTDPVLETAYFMLLTSRSNLSDRVVGLDAGADDFLSKPVDICELKARIRAGLRLYHSTQALQALAQDLQCQKQKLESELAEAATYVKSLLPAPMTEPFWVDNRFLPSQQLGGDCFDYYWLNPDCLVIYLLDVSGHGLGAALLSVSVQNMLRSHALPDSNYYQPHTVLSTLNDAFQMGKQNNRYLTMWYGIYHRPQHQLVYASAGHPPAILVAKDATANPQVTRLTTRGAPIGMLPGTQYTSNHCTLESASSLYIFSDGIYEITKRDGIPWNLDGFVTLLSDLSSASDCRLDNVLEHIRQLKSSNHFEDDCSIIQMKFS